MSFVFSNLSKQRLAQAHPDLKRVFERAIQLSSIDFRIQETLRTEAQQRENIRKGASQTMNSYHIPRKGENFSRAVDVIALIKGADGKLGVSWAEMHYYKIYDAVRKAAKELNVNLTYGGAWDQGSMKDFPEVDGDGMTVRAAVFRYADGKRAKKQKPFLDIGHVQIEL